MTNVTTESSDGGEATQSGGGTTGITGETSGSETDAPQLDPDSVDILFVIDNSGTMSEEQAQVNEEIEALIDPLIEAGLSLRIGITTTDAGNPQCSKASTTPENGALVLSSCLERVALGDFDFDGTDPPIDGAPSCTDYCGLGDSELQVEPTATAEDPTPAPRPWVEVEGADSNVGEVGVVNALRCFLPMGVNGCGFESPLEAMHKALLRSDVAGEVNFGFLREEARLVIVMVTDETDCSYNESYKDIFQTNKVFWNSPDDPKPSSAVCWRAGVSCVGSPPNRECFAENHDISGSSGASDSSAVLHPLSRYTDLLTELAASKGSASAVELHLIAGVPEGYADGASIEYSEGSSPEFVDNFGIGPGCVSAVLGGAVPSVREREVAEALAGGGRPVYSICASSYVPAFDAIVASILDE